MQFTGACGTCEGGLLQVPTGVIPFTKIVTTEQLASREKSGLDIRQTMRRAETAVVRAFLKTVCDDLAAFLAKVDQGMCANDAGGMSPRNARKCSRLLFGHRYVSRRFGRDRLRRPRPWRL